LPYERFDPLLQNIPNQIVVDSFQRRKREISENAQIGLYNPALDPPFYPYGPQYAYWNTPFGSGYSSQYNSESGVSQSYSYVNGQGTILIL
jgi:hypothetical protein